MLKISWSKMNLDLRNVQLWCMRGAHGWKRIDNKLQVNRYAVDWN